MVNLASFWKPEACGQIVLPDRSLLKGQKLVKNTKIQKFKYDNLSNLQTIWIEFNCEIPFEIQTILHRWRLFFMAVWNGRIFVSLILS